MQGNTFLSGRRVTSSPHAYLCNTTHFNSQPQRVQRQPVKPFVVENRVVIRFQRFGRKKLPFYRIVAIDSRSRRQGVPCERLGWYNPLTKETNLDAPAIKKWLEVGAKPTEAAARILRRAMVIDPDHDKSLIAS